MFDCLFDQLFKLPHMCYDVVGRSQPAAACVVDLALYVVLRGAERARRPACQFRPAQSGRQVH